MSGSAPSRRDIVLAVPDSADEPAYVPALEAAGYVLWSRTWRHVQHYADAKSTIVEQIVAHAAAAQPAPTADPAS